MSKMLARKGTALFVTTVVALGALLAGCGEQTAGSAQAAPTPTITPTAWVDQFCAAVVATKPPSGLTPFNRIDPSDVAAISKNLTIAIEAYRAGLTALDKLEKSPIKSGDEAVAKLKLAIGGISSALMKARDTVSGLSPSDPDTRATVTTAVNTAIAEGKAIKPDLSGLEDAEFKTAAQSAPTCKANGMT